MSCEHLSPLPEADIDVARAWATSGAQALTHPDVTVPARLVRTVAGLIEQLDAAGADLGQRFPPNGLGALTERAGALLFGRAGAASCGGGSRLLRASDDWIAATIARRDDRGALPAWLGVDPAAPCVVTNADPWTEVARRVARRDAGDLVELAIALGLACATVGEVAPASAMLADRLGDAPPRPVAGLRVANLASLWAGPLAAAVLARLGADVVTVESTGRPDGARATPAWFDAMHAGQRSVALDFRSEQGVARLAELLGAADVVIEGSRPRALQQLGISASGLVGRGPRVWLSITAYGRDPACAMRVGFGDDAAAAGNLVGWVGEGPVFLADAVTDPVTGLISAAAIVDLVESGGRWLVDVALARVAAELSPRPSDPIVRGTYPPAPPPALGAPAPPFGLGADTDAVVRDWLGR
jgi:hypothetical protein